MKLTELLDRIDRLDQEVTEEPWTFSGGKVYEPSGYPLPGCTSCGENEATYEGQDAEFIALSRTALPQLAEALRAVLDVLDDYTMPGKLHDPTGIAGAELESLEQYIREAITDAMGADHDHD